MNGQIEAAAVAGPVFRRQQIWQGITLCLLTTGYAGYYACRSNLSACTPAICDELRHNGWNYDDAITHVGDLASLGVLAYAVGKLLGGWLTDRIGGRTSFVGAMFVASLCTASFAVGNSFLVWIPLWLANRLAQSVGWPGMMRISSRWFAPATRGLAIGVISLSFLFGDAAARWMFGRLFANGFDWRDIFLVSGCLLGTLCLINLAFLRESPLELGLAEMPDEFSVPLSKDQCQPRLREIIRRPAFLVACGLCFTLTAGRETFNTWTATYFRDVAGMTTAEAADASKGFPLYGGTAVLLAGIFRDRLGRSGQSVVLVCGPIAAGMTILSLAATTDPANAVRLVNASGFFLLAPYSYFSGVIALDFGGKQSGASASGVIDGVGYLGGVLAGGGLSRLVKLTNWPTAFVTLSVITTATGFAAIAYAFMTRKSDHD